MQLAKYNPFRELDKIQKDFERFWEQDFDMSLALPEWSTMDMYEEDGKVIAEFSLPNFAKDEINVTTEKGMLEVSAEHEEKEEEKKKRRYYRRESSNRFWRRVALPEGAQDEHTQAAFKDGVLKVTMPIDTKAIEETGKKITIT